MNTLTKTGAVAVLAWSLGAVALICCLPAQAGAVLNKANAINVDEPTRFVLTHAVKLEGEEGAIMHALVILGDFATSDKCKERLQEFLKLPAPPEQKAQLACIKMTPSIKVINGIAV